MKLNVAIQLSAPIPLCEPDVIKGDIRVLRPTDNNNKYRIITTTSICLPEEYNTKQQIVTAILLVHCYNELPTFIEKTKMFLDGKIELSEFKNVIAEIEEIEIKDSDES